MLYQLTELFRLMESAINKLQSLNVYAKQNVKVLLSSHCCGLVMIYRQLQSNSVEQIYVLFHRYVSVFYGNKMVYLSFIGYCSYRLQIHFPEHTSHFIFVILWCCK